MAEPGDEWRTSSRSGTNGQCLAVRCHDGVVQVKDGTDRRDRVLSFTPEQWAAFLAGTKSGEFDR